MEIKIVLLLAFMLLMSLNWPECFNTTIVLGLDIIIFDLVVY